MNRPSPTIDPGGPSGVWSMILALQDAMTVSDVQSRFLASISDVVGADSYGFSRFDATDYRLQPLSVRTKGAPEGLVPAYNAIGAERDPILAAAIALGSPAYNSELMSEGDWRSQSLYEVLDGHGLYHSLVVPLFDKTRPSGALYLARSSERPFSAAEVSILKIVQPHVAMSLCRAETFAGLQRSVEMLKAAIDQIDSATVINTRDGVEIHANKAYDRLAGADRRIRATVASLVRVNASRLAEGTERMVVGTEALHEATHEYSADANPILRIVVRSSVLRSDMETIVSSIYLQRQDTGTPVQWAPLSVREREIAAWVAQGLTNRQIAALAFVSENTVRQHLKRIFIKLEVHNRAQLTQAIWQSAGPSTSPNT